jgi:hypothetical protein
MRPQFQLTRTASLAALLLSTAVIPLSRPAEADDIDPLYCSLYSQQAVKDAKVNAAYGCFSRQDGRWSTNGQNHYDYCTSGEPDKAFLDYEWAARHVEAGNCSYCNKDETAVASGNRVLDNKLYNCGFTGPEWSDDPNERRNACINQPGGSPGVRPFLGVRLWMTPVSAKMREQELQKKVDKCKANYDPRIASSCEDYATQAVNQGIDYLQYKGQACAADQALQDPSRWSRNWAFHFSWCMKPESANFVAEEQNARQTVINRCTFANSINTPNDLARKAATNAVPPGLSSFSQSATTPITTRPAGTSGLFGGGFDTSKRVTSFSQPVNIPITSQPNLTSNGRVGGGFDKVVPSSGQPAAVPITSPSVGVTGAPTGGGIDTSKRVPSFTPAPMPAHPVAIPSGPIGSAIPPNRIPSGPIGSAIPPNRIPSGPIGSAIPPNRIPSVDTPATAPMPTRPVAVPNVSIGGGGTATPRDAGPVHLGSPAVSPGQPLKLGFNGPNKISGPAPIRLH